MDQGAGNKAYLVSYEDGKVLRSFETETDKSSGITFDGKRFGSAPLIAVKSCARTR